MSGAVYVWGGPTADRLVRNSLFDKVTLELRPQCSKEESLVTLGGMCPGAGNWQCQGLEACLARSTSARRPGRLKTGCRNTEDRRWAQRGAVVVGGIYHGGPLRPGQELGFYSG